MPRKEGQKEAMCKIIERLYNDGLGDDEIAEQTGLKKKTVQIYRRQMGLYHMGITKKWLNETGIGDDWDEACRRIRRGCGRV